MSDDRGAEWTPMSSGQRSLWFEQMADPGSNAYNLGTCVRFAARFDPARLDAALGVLAERHALLRARFDLAEDGEPACRIAAEPIACQRLTPGPGGEPQARARVAQALLRPYALADEPPFRFAYADLQEGGSLFAVGAHHIVADLHSFALLLRELDEAYGREPGAGEPRASYAEFCEWQREMLGDERGRQSAAFWKERLSGVGGSAGLGELESGSADAPPTAGRIDFGIAPESARAILETAKGAGTTPFVLLLTTLQGLLAQRLDRRKVVVGSPASGRNQARFRGTLGYFVNLLPMAFDYDRRESFARAAARNEKLVRGALKHGQYPFGGMVENFAPERARGASPLVQVTLTYQKTVSGLEDHLTRLALGLPGGGFPLAGEFGEMAALPESRAQFPLGIAIAPSGGGFAGCLQFDQARIDRASAECFLADWLALTARCAAGPQLSFGLLMSEAGSAASEDDGDTLVSALESCIERHAERCAISSPGAELSYRHLGERSNAIASELRALGAGRGHRVAVIGDGDAGTVCAMVGVLRAGAAFVPIDADIAEDQRNLLLEAAQVSAVLTGSDPARPTKQTPPPASCGPLDPAWLMFTSGTTGRPKAAVVPHEAALSHARAIAARFGLGTDDRVLQFASLSFDEHAEEVFPTLLAGACIVCRPRVRFQDPESLLRVLDETRVTILHLPTSYWHVWMDEAAHSALPVPRALRIVNAGGEQASVARLRTWAQVVPPRVRWFNSYGLTEAAVTSLLYEFRASAELERMARVPAGRPLRDALVRIVRDDGTEAPAGEEGELWLGGPGVGLGYFGNAEATEARFFTENGVRWLRTGDLACAGERGEVIVTGRRDRALKLRGARIDPAEIEAILGGNAAVSECVVAMAAEAGTRGDASLDLHVVVREGHALSETELRDFWRTRVPRVPPPERICFRSSIPRTAGRKPDFARLGIPKRSAEPSTGAPVRGDPVSERIAAVFARLLQRDSIDPGADFFVLGGHSLLAMRLIAALRRELGVEFTIADFMAQPTVDAVAEVCRMRGVTGPGPGDGAGSAATGAATPPYPLSVAQRRVLLLGSAIGEAQPRVSLAFRIRGELDAGRLARAWAAVVRRHPLLTAAISETGNVEGGASQPASLQRLEWKADSARAAFERDADHAAPVVAALLAGGVKGDVLVIEARHTTVDGGCVPVLLRDLAAAYDAPGATLPPPGPGYRRFVAAEAEWRRSPARAAAAAYWEERLRGAGPPTRLPAMAEARVADFASRRLSLTLGAAFQRELLGLARAHRCTPYAVLLAAFAVLASRYSANEEVLVGVPVALRDALGVDDVVGPTLNALPFRLRVSPGDSFSDLVHGCRNALAASFAHAALPFEEIVGGLPIPIHFVAQEAAGHARFGELKEREGRSPVALLVGIRVGEDIRIEFEYRRAVLADADAAKLLESFRILARELVAEPAGKVGEARMLPRAAVARALLERPASAGDELPALLHAGLEAMARSDPARVALVCREGALSYAQLDALAELHAQRLISSGMAPGDRVVVASRKGREEVIAALAILKAGGVYVPIAFDMPHARAAALAARAGARLVTGVVAPTSGFAQDTRFQVVPVALDAPAAQAPRGRNVRPDDSAYILFTSGSTGEPKGVEVSHRAALGTIDEILRRFGLGAHDVFYALSAMDFDLSVFDIFGALRAGARVVLPAPEVKSDAFAWAADVTSHGISVWNSVPSALDMLLEAAGDSPLPSLRRLLASGDWIGLDLPGRAKSACPDAVFVALGGATEASIWSNCQVVDEVDPRWRSIPYGRALDGQSMFVLEPGGWPAPTGVPGEICIGGAGLAKGYWGDPVQSAEKFVAHAQSGGRIYRTGDLGRYFPDGAIEFLGRLDRQVKLRGHRIETGEVEAALSRFPGVRRALAAVRTDRVVAYIQTHEAARMDVAGLRRHAEGFLPEYMRPADYRKIESIPLTANGKIDWDALPAPRQGRDAAADAGADHSDAERKVAALWRELLPGCAARRDENFFSAGGHSLLAVRLVARARREFGREISLARWLNEPTVAHMARLAEAPAAANEAAARPVRSTSALRERARLADDIVASSPRPGNGGAIFVTGATGLIGSRIAMACLTQPQARVICLVRPGTRSRLPRQDRIHVIEGDLTQPRFGLGDAEFTALAAGVRTIFHVGAAVNLIAPYEQLEAANVGGTHEAVRLAMLAGVPLHYVSSIGVLPYGAGRRVTETDPIDVPGQLLTGYCQSKWVAEQTVRLAAARGLRAAVYRPGLTLDEQAAPGGEPDLLASLMALARKVGSLPRLEMPIDLVTADYVAAAIVRMAEDPRSIGGTFHLTHPHPVELIDVLAMLGGAGSRLPLRPFDEWKALLEVLLPDLEDPRLAAFGALIAAQEEADITPARVDCSATAALLEGTGIGCESVPALMARLLLRPASP